MERENERASERERDSRERERAKRERAGGREGWMEEGPLPPSQILLRSTTHQVRERER